MQTSRPDLKIPYSPFEKSLEVLAAAIFLFCGIFIATSYPNLPERIPMHFNFTGAVDVLGPRTSLITLYAIIGGLYLFLSLISRFPRFYNYPVAITPENAPTHYRMGRMLVNVIKVETLALLTCLVWSIVAAAQDGLPPYVLTAALMFFMILIFITTILFLIKLMKQR